MYEKLVKWLRQCDEQFECRGCKYEQIMGCRAKLNAEAADVIEELQKNLEQSKDFEAFWQHEAEEALRKFQVAISRKPIVEPKQTNADTIRSMSDEELASFMNHGACPPGENVSELCCDEDGGSVPDMCNLCWLNWLREPNSNS